MGGEPAPVGTVVEARGANVITDVPGNPIVTTVAGEYGTVSEPKLVVQGPNIKQGDIIEFYINGRKANETYAFQGGGRHTRLDLTIASAPAPPPANFVVTNLKVFPVEVEPGQTVAIEVELTNSGGTEGTYTVTLKINTVAEMTYDITLAPGEDGTVTFATAKDTPGSYHVEVDDWEQMFIVTEPTEPEPSIPAGLTLSELSISPSEVDAGQTVTVRVVVANTGEEAGSCTVSFKINGVVEETKSVDLAAGASQVVTFTTSKDKAGSYLVEFNGLSGTFTVKERPAPPAPPPAAKARVKWHIVGPIIGVAVFLAIFLPIRMRKKRFG